MTLSDLRTILIGSPIDEVFLCGFIHRDERMLRFHASLSSYFLECGATLLRISAVGYSGRCLINRTSTPSSDFELDDDMELAVTSISQWVLLDPDAANQITRATLWDMQETSLGVECSAFRLDLCNEQVLFFDPSYHFGIRLGGIQQQGIWSDNAVSKDHSPTELTFPLT